MKKLAFTLLFAIPMMLFSCGSDSSNPIDNSPNIPLTKTTNTANSFESLNVTQLDSISAKLDRSTHAIDANIKALNDAEVELVKAFDLK